MKDFAAGVRKTGFDRRDNFLQPVRIHGTAMQYFGRECAEDVAPAAAGQDFLAFPRSEHGICVVLENQRQ